MGMALPLEHFQLVTDQVMGGVSRGTLTRETVLGQQAVRMRGQVSLENNGGFIQMAADLDRGRPFDASAFTGISFQALGNGQTYNVHLRTTDITRPWQSYRQSFIAGQTWESHRIAFTDFVAHRIDMPLDVTRLTRIGIVAIGREMEVDLDMADMSLD